VSTVLGFVWTLPNTLLGVVAGLLTFQRPRLAHGLLLFDRRPRGLTTFLRAIDREAMTLGYVVVSASPVEGTLLEHERHHVRQYRRWGPLFIPAYLVLAAAYGYRRHPMERAAEERARREAPPSDRRC
jgi:hypothetical protein